MSGILYLVGTPIGNLEDLSPRAARILSEVDFIAAEDTRNSMKLLSHLGIRKEMVSYYEHNKTMRADLLLSRLQNGESCALITDAGMPAISDPGEDIVRLCHQNGIETVVIPGPCAAVCALALSGLPSRRFAFEGFLPVPAGERRKCLSALKGETRTLIFYEAPHRLAKTLKDLYAAFGEREIALVKEITKIHETTENIPLSQAVSRYEKEENIRGEFVLIVTGASEIKQEMSDEEIVELLREKTAAGMSRSEAAKAIAAEFEIPKNRVYRLSK